MKNLPHPEPLNTALAAVLQPTRQHAEHLTKRDALQREIADFIATGDPADDHRAQQVGGFRIQVEMAPHVLARLSSEAEERHPLLITAIERFERALIEVRVAERESIIDRIEKAIKPLAPDRRGSDGQWVNVARGLAADFPEPNALPVEPQWFNAERLHSNPNAPEAVRRTIARAQGLLAIHERVSSRGKFSTEDFTWG